MSSTTKQHSLGQNANSHDPCTGNGISMPRFVQPVLLALLAKESMHGYVLMQKLAEIGLFADYSPDMAGMYRKLREMERNGVLEILAETSKRGPQRKKYVITESGRACLAQWMKTLGRTKYHLDGVLELVQQARAGEEGASLTFAEGSAGPAASLQDEAAESACPQEDRDFVRQVKDRVLAGLPVSKADIVHLLSWDPDSPQVAELGRAAREMASLVTGNMGTVWAAIGVDCQPCSVYCAAAQESCAKAESDGQVQDGIREQIMATARRLAADGAAWVILRCTSRIDEACLRSLLVDVKNQLPQGCVLIASARHLSMETLQALREAGTEAVYYTAHMEMLGEFPLASEERLQGLQRITGTGFLLAHLVEPVGPEYSNEDLADNFLAAQAAGAGMSGVLLRSNAADNETEQAHLSAGRLAQIVAVTRLCGGRKMPHICTYPPVPQALDWGANVLLVGAAVTEDGVLAPWHGLGIEDAQKMLQEHNYTVTSRIY